MVSERLTPNRDRVAQPKEQFPGTKAAEDLVASMREGSPLEWKDEDGGYFEYSKEVDGAVEAHKIRKEYFDPNESDEKIAAWAQDVAVQRQKSFIEFGDTKAEADKESVEEEIRESGTHIVLMRNEAGEAIGYAEFELREIEPGGKEAYIFDWLVHVDQEYRGSGLGTTVYALAAEQCIAEARKEGKEIVAIATSAIEVADASFTRGINPTYPFIKDAEGRMVELKELQIPEGTDSYSGDVHGRVFRHMIRFLDHKETRPTEDVGRVLTSIYRGYGEGGDDAYVALVQKSNDLIQKVLEKASDGTVSLLDGKARNDAKESAGEKFFEAEQFSDWLQHYPDLKQANEELEAAIAAYNAAE